MKHLTLGDHGQAIPGLKTIAIAAAVLPPAAQAQDTVPANDRPAPRRAQAGAL